MATFRRRLIREKVLQVMYAHELSKDPLFFIQDQQLGDLTEHPVELAFAKELIRSMSEHRAELDARITTRVDNWEFGRIALIDKIMLRMGICEMLYFPDIPPKVSINEAIEIVKVFSTEKSANFINGVLDSILNDLRKSQILKKSGRGLVDQGSSVVSEASADTSHTGTGGTERKKTPPASSKK